MERYIQSGGGGPEIITAPPDRGFFGVYPTMQLMDRQYDGGPIDHNLPLALTVGHGEGRANPYSPRAQDGSGRHPNGFFHPFFGQRSRKGQPDD